MSGVNFLKVAQHRLKEVSMNEYEAKIHRGYELYNRELKKGVELGRKLGAFERRFGKLRTHVTEHCAVLALLGVHDDRADFLALRNAVRIMKGKNTL